MEKNNLCEKMGRFAQDHILPCHNLGRGKNFPLEIWSAMGKTGLLNPENLLDDRPCLGIVQTVRAMVENGGNLGLALSWMIHQMTAHYLVRPNLACLVDKGFWDRVKTGEATVCFAVSEPNAGAHPKYMEARAEKLDHYYQLSGEKAYLTNGPIASCFLVIAITGRENDRNNNQDNGRKAFSAFLLPRDTPGLIVDSMDIPFFKPSPHGNIRMDNCLLDRDALLGVEGRAFLDMVLFFRKMEDAAMTGALTGAMSFILSRAAGSLAAGSVCAEQLEALGTLGAMTETAIYLSDRIALMADKGEGPQDSLVLCVRQMVQDFLEVLDRILKKNATPLEGAAAVLVHDLSSSARIGGTVVGIQKQKLGRRIHSRAVDEIITE